MTLLSLLEQLYNMPQCVSYSQFVKVRQDIRNHPDYHTIRDEFEQTYTKETGWILCGADFNALEAKIDALLTKDPNKEAVYANDYDSHAYNSYYYWKERFPDIRVIPDEDIAYKVLTKTGYIYVTSDDLLLENTNTISVEDFYNATNKWLQ